MNSIKQLFQLFILTLMFCPSQTVAQQDEPEHAWTAEKAVEFALKNNPDSEIAKKKILRAQALIDQANSFLYPDLSLSSSYDGTNNPMYSFGNILNQGAFETDIDFNDPGRTDNLKIKADLHFVFYDGGKTRSSITASKLYRDSLIAQKKAVLNQLAFEVVATFQEIIKAMEMVEAQKSSLKAIEASLNVAKARHNAGDLLRQELLNIEVLQARATENLIQARHALNLSHHAFNNLLGITNAQVILDTEFGIQQEIPSALDYFNRPELQEIDKGIAAVEAKIQAAGSGRLPTVKGFASYQYEHGFENDGSGDSWMAGIALNYSLYDGNLTNSRIAEKEAVRLELLEQKRKITLRLNLQLQQAEQEMQQAQQRIHVTEKMVILAEESARLSRARFKEGVILSSDLIDVETRLTDALLRNSQAKALYKIAVANLRKTVGLQQF